MGHPRQHVQMEGHHRRQARGVVEGTGSEVGERQRGWAEVVAAKAASGES
jgi:hypothetical protein